MPVDVVRWAPERDGEGPNLGTNFTSQFGTIQPSHESGHKDTAK